MIQLKRISLEAPKLPRREGIIDYPVSCDYNGGCFVKGHGLISGFDVPAPIVPSGYKLVELHFGLNYNAKPPMKKNMLRKI